MPDRSYRPPPERREPRDHHDFTEPYGAPPRRRAPEPEELILTWVWALLIVAVVAVLIWFIVTTGEPIVW